MLMSIEGIEYDYCGDVFVDVGGNIGMWTTQIGPYFKNIVFIEPSKIAISEAKKNIEKAGIIDKVNFIKKICCSIDGQRQNISATQSDSGNFTVHGNILYSSNQIAMSEDNIETMTLNSLISLIKPESRVIVKIDTEGSELDILLGGKEFIQIVRPVIVLETHYHMYYDDKKEQEIMDFLTKYNYTISKFKMLNYKNTPHIIYDGKHNGTQMYDLHYHILLDPK